MVFHCNSSRGLQRTLICTTFVRVNRETQTLTPQFPRSPLNTFWKCAESEVSCAGRVRTVCLTLLAGVGAICTRCVQKACENGEQKNTGKKETRTEYQGGITGHVGVLATIMILTGIYINIVTTED